MKHAALFIAFCVNFGMIAFLALVFEKPLQFYICTSIAVACFFLSGETEGEGDA